VKVYPSFSSLAFGAGAIEVDAQKYDWLLGDKKSGSGKLVFGVFALRNSGLMSGARIVYRHNSRYLTLQGSEISKNFTIWSMEEGVQKVESIQIRDLRSRTVSICRGSFTASGPYQFGAIQR
jgi:hypothetical protein